jgi:hypothetical protein
MLYFRALNFEPNPSPAPARVSFAWAIAACACVLIWQLLTIHYNRDGNWTALFQTGQALDQPPKLRPGTYLFAGMGYDGQMYRYVAHDPFLRSGLERYIDSPTLRYRRILIPALAFFLAGGHQPWIDAAFIAVTALFVLLGTYWLSRWAVLHGFHPAWALAFPLVPATIISMDRMTVDGALAALTVGFAYIVTTKQTAKLYVLLVLACLVRETGALLVAGCVLVEMQRKEFIRSAMWATAALPALAWYAFLFLNLHAVRITSGFPTYFHIRWSLGIIGQMFRPQRYNNLSAVLETLARSLDSVALIGIVCALIAGIVLVGTRPLDLISMTCFVHTVLGIAMASRLVWFDCYGYGRVMSPMLILIALQALASKRPVKAWWWMLLPVPLVDLRLGLQLGPQALGIVRGLLGY